MLKPRLKNRILPILMVTLIFQFEPIQAQALFEGKIINASRDSIGIADFPIRLLSRKTHAENPAAVGQTQSSSKGAFQFRIEQTDTTAFYYAVADFQGVTYYSEGARFLSHTGRLARTIVVYDSTHSTAAVTIPMHHLFIEDAGEVISVRESRILNNSSTRAVVNAQEDSLLGAYTFSYSLPFAARNFAPSTTVMTDELELVGQRVLDKSVALPGNRQVSYTYEIPWQRDAAAVSLDISFLTRSLQVFIGNPQIKVASEQLQDLGPFVIRGTSYQRFGANELAPGTRVQFTLRRNGSHAQEPSALILPLTAIILLGGLLFALAQKPQSAPTQKPKDQAKLLARKKELIHAIAKIDAKLETQDNAQMKRQRQDLFHELQRIEITLREDTSVTKSKKR